MPSKTTTHAAKTRRAGLLFTALLALAIVASTLIAFTLIRARAGSGSTLTSADLHAVSTTSFDISLFASGELEARNQKELRSGLESQATITEVVDEGIRVKQGDILITLNSDNILTQIQEEELRVESSRSDHISAQNSLDIQINENEAATRQVNLKLELAQIEWQKWEEGDLLTKRQELALDIEKADRNLELYTEQYEKTLDLYGRGFESKDKLKQDEIRSIEAQAEVKRAALAEKVYELYEYVQTRKKLESDVEEATQELGRVKKQNESQVASKQADLTNKQRQLEIRQEKLARLREQLDACTMHAPTDGLVVYATSIGASRGRYYGEGPLQIGRSVYPNELLIVLPDTSEMVAAVQVHEANAGRIHPGQPVTIKLDAIPDTPFSGKVLSISVLAESGGWRDPNLREYTVKILLDPNDFGDKLKPSLRADTEIFLGSVTDDLAVPMQAIYRDGPVSFVYAKRGDRYARVPVTIGQRSSTQAQLTAGIDLDEIVLLREPSPGEIINQPFDEQQLLALGYSATTDSPPTGTFASNQRPVEVVANTAEQSDSNQSGDTADRPKGQRMGREQMKKFVQDNAGKNIDDLELSKKMKEALKKLYPDGKIPASTTE